MRNQSAKVRVLAVMMALNLVGCSEQARDRVQNVTQSPRADDTTTEINADKTATEIDADNATTETEQFWTTVRELYDKAKKSGETIPDNVTEWAKQDLTRIGTWEYRILQLETDDTTDVEAGLNRLGQQRWECFWIEETDTGKKYYLKRSGRSYLKSFGDVTKFIPIGQTQE